MLLRVRASAAVAVAVVALSTTWAIASAVQPATHRFAKGEHFRYTDVVAVGGGEGRVAIDASKTVRSVDDFEVVDVSASGTMLAHHAEDAGATGFPPTTRYIRVTADGAWRYADGRIGENVVTWDPVHFGPQTRSLAVGQHWYVDVPAAGSRVPSRVAVRVVSVDPDNLVLHADGRQAPSRRGSIRVTHAWSTDVAFAHGIVRNFHRVDREHMERGPAKPAFNNRTDRSVRLIAQTGP